MLRYFQIKFLKSWAVVGYKVEAEIVLMLEIGCRKSNSVFTAGKIFSFPSG